MPARASAWPSSKRSSTKARASSPASRSTASLEGLDGVTGVELDLSTPDAPGQLVQRALDEHGRVDVLVNNVGAVKLRLDGFLATTDDDFAWAMQMNFFIALRATRAAIAAMVTQGGGRSSTSARSTRSSSPTAAPSTTAPPRPRSLNLSKSLAQEFGPQRHPRQLRVTRAGQHRPLVG